MQVAGDGWQGNVRNRAVKDGHGDTDNDGRYCAIPLG